MVRFSSVSTGAPENTPANFVPSGARTTPGTLAFASATFVAAAAVAAGAGAGWVWRVSARTSHVPIARHRRDSIRKLLRGEPAQLGAAERVVRRRTVGPG